MLPMHLGDQVSAGAERQKGKQERTSELRQNMGRSRCCRVTLPVSLLKPSSTGLAVGGGWHPEHSAGAACPSSGPTVLPGLGAVCKSLQPAIQSGFQSAVSSFYLCQSQILWVNRQTDFCKASAMDTSNSVIIRNFDSFASAEFYFLVPFAESQS